MELREFIEELEKRNLLKRVKTKVSAVYEIAEIVNRACKSKEYNYAFLFENVDNYDIPVAVNLFGSFERLKIALGVENFEDLGNELLEILKPELPSSFIQKIKSLSKIKKLSDFIPKIVKKGECKEVVYEGDSVDLSRYPILKLWPKDAGRFITFPMVITKDPETGERNVGMYRMQVLDKNRTCMHWQIHKHGALHYKKALELGEELEVAVAIGSDPITMLSAILPLPEGFDELSFAGFLRKEPVKLVKCETIDLEVPANAEIVLEGYVDEEKALEGPFGDHTGYYSHVEEYPVFKIKCITQREDPIYVASVTGKPPMEDAYIGKMIERMFLPIIKMQIPEIVDINMPIESVFHNLIIVSIKKRYPGHAKKVMFSLWGLGIMSLTKAIVVVDHTVNVQNLSEVLWAVSTRVDPARDIIIIPNAPTDNLDHASPMLNLGSKIGIDATIKTKEEGFEREFPEEVEASEDIKRLVDKKWENYFL